MGRKAKAMTIEELKEFMKNKSIKTLLKYEEIENEEQFEQDYKDDFIEQTLPYWVEDSTLNKDLSKIQFDFENTFASQEEYDIQGVGYQNIGNLTYIGIIAGGDWECPIYFILYVDDKNKLRGYIPTNGNVFNKKLKSAFGNNDGTSWDERGQVIKTGYSDEDAIKEQFGTEDFEDFYINTDNYFDWEKIKLDIINRIQLQ